MNYRVLLCSCHCPCFPPKPLLTSFLCAAAAAAVTSVVSNSMRPHRRQPARLPRPWDSPGKNTGVGCHFLLQCMKVKSESEVAQSWSRSLRPHGLQPTRLLRPWDFPGKSVGVGCHCLLWNSIYRESCICMSSANSDSFIFSFAIWNPVSFSCLIAVSRTFNAMLNKNDKSEHLSLVPDLRWNAFSFSLLSMI